MNKIVKESKKVIELQPKINEVFNEINGYASGYKTLENENKNIKREIQILEYKNNQLEKENNKLNDKIKDELFDYANVPDQYRTIRTPLYDEDYNNDYEYISDEEKEDNFDISL